MKEDKLNLTGIMYDEDGNFIPLTSNDGNINGKLAHLRNTYMEAEKYYFECLLSVDSIRKKFTYYLKCDSEQLLKYAAKLQYRLEYGLIENAEELEMMKTMTPQQRDEFHMKKLEETEGILCLLYAAARDKTKILELVRVYSDEPYTRSR